VNDRGFQLESTLLRHTHNLGVSFILAYQAVVSHQPAQSQEAKYSCNQASNHCLRSFPRRQFDEQGPCASHNASCYTSFELSTAMNTYYTCDGAEHQQRSSSSNRSRDIKQRHAVAACGRLWLVWMCICGE
jgi:hypothetical protein